jgi:hypothetical protein
MKHERMGVRGWNYQAQPGGRALPQGQRFGPVAGHELIGMHDRMYEREFRDDFW